MLSGMFERLDTFDLNYLVKAFKVFEEPFIKAMIREFNETRNLTLTRNEKPGYEKYEISRNTRFTQK